MTHDRRRADDRIVRALEDNTRATVREGAIMSAKFDALITETKRGTTIQASMLPLLERLEAAKNDPTEIANILAEVRSQNDTYAAAVLSGTPNAAPAPVDPNAARRMG